MYQECSMRVTKVSDSPMFSDKTENTSLFMQKIVVNKNTLRTHYLGITLIQKITMFPYHDKQIILFTSMRNNNPEL